MKSVQFPKVEVKDGESLLSFYDACGWDREKQIDPTKVVVSPKKWKEMCSGFEIPAQLGFMNYGPSAKEGVPNNKVHIYSGAFH